MLAALLTPSPASAQEAEPPAPEIRCDIEAFGQEKLLDDAVPYPAYPGIKVGQTNSYELPAPVSGRLVVSGISADQVHEGEVIDFDIRRSQFSERFAVEFLDAAGNVVGTTTPTPDLPDVAVAAPFALPSIDIGAEATAIRLRHVGDGQSPNSILAPCLNIDVVTADTPPGDQVRPSICPTDLAIPVEGLQCGFLAVPEERNDPASRLIQVAFAVVPGSGEFADPLFYLEGGPGGPPINITGVLLELAGFGQIGGGRDLVFIDQRGTGYSNPNLNCPPAPPDIDFATFNEICFAALSATGVPLSAYTTVENAEDVADLRIALGYDEYNLFGGSYGTNLGLTIMRDRPEGIRSSILDSVFPPDVNIFGGDELVGTVNLLQGLVDRCNADAPCAEALPDLKADINQAFTNLTAEPVPLREPARSFIGVDELTAPILFGLLAGELINPSTAALFHELADPDPAAREEALNIFNELIIFQILEEVTAGPPEGEGPPDGDEPPDAGPMPDIDIVAILDTMRIIKGVPGAGALFSEGFNATVICAEEAPFADLPPATTLPPDAGWNDDVINAAQASLPGLAEYCGAFAVDAEVPEVNDPISSDIPSLVLLSDVDFQTYPEWSRLAAETLPNSFTYEFPGVAHVTALSNPECAGAIAAQFVADPTTAPDDSCIAETLAPVTYFGELPPDPGDAEAALAELDEFFGPPPGVE